VLKRLLTCAFVCVCLIVLAASASRRAAAQSAPAYPPVTDARLRAAGNDDGWLMYLRSYRSDGHAPFRQITTANVGQLQEVFTHDISIPNGFEAPPIVNGSTMIVTTPLDHVYALDATSGRKLWQYDYPLPTRALRTVCCDMVNRGVALYGTAAYMETLDNHVVALDARSGKLLWNHAVLSDSGMGFEMSGAPLAVRGLIIVGSGGGEYGARGFLEALDASTGAERWRRYTIPAPNEPGGKTWPGQTYLHGGGDPWVTGSYDVQTDTLLWGVGNPAPWLADQRKGRNLYTDSVLAMNPSTGAIKWYFQQTPNDPWDYDAVNTPSQADVTIAGKRRRVFYQASRNGYFYTVDRTNGDVLVAKPLMQATSVLGYDRAHRIGLVNDALKPRVGQTVFTCPAAIGGVNWWPPAFSPQTGYAYVSTVKACMRLAGIKPTAFLAGARYTDEAFTIEHEPGQTGWGQFQAIDVATGKQMWHFDTRMPWNDGSLATDGGLVFSGTPDQLFYAFDARTGKVLWKHHMRSGVLGVPMSYRVNGRQYVAVQSGFGGVFTTANGSKVITKLFRGIPQGGRLYVFALPQARQ